ncbi:MAG: T9SS type A sorting domain-containing protein [Bacteroidetes bacterium]|nr:T9SS type A sorting domain-containing protein [Bacteroidota bacterium]
MKKLFLCALLFIGANLSAQWDTLQTNCATNFRDIFFVSRDTGFAVGADAAGHADIRMTTDAGSVWTQPVFPANFPGLNAVRFFSSTEGWAVGNSGVMMKTTNNGMNWDTVSAVTAEDLYSINIPTSATIYIAGVNGTLMRSSDDGATWAAITNSGTSLDINDLHFINSSAGFICGNGGFISATGDACANWTFFTQPYGGFFNANGYDYAGTTNNAFCVGDYGLSIFSTDAGITWNTQTLPTAYNLNKVRFGNDLGGLIVGDHGTIFISIDGGTSWYDDTVSFIHENLYSAAYDHDTSAYVCGDAGTILKSLRDISSVHENISTGISASVFPNPFNDQFNISFALKNSSAVKIEIADVTGRIISENNYGTIGAGEHIFSCDEIADAVPGIYFVKVMTENSAMTIPVVKE